MTTFYTLMAAMALMLPASLTAQQNAVSLPELSPASPMIGNTTLPTQFKMQPCNEISADTPIATAITDPTDWDIVEGDWQYRSQYTGKTYPTSVKVQYITDVNGVTRSAKMALTNDLFGTIILGTNLVTGDTFSHNDRDENGNPIRPKLLDENNNPIDMTINIDYIGRKQCYGSWSAYPLSGKSRLLARYIPLVNGETDISNGHDSYDYLYNTQAIDCKITADYAKSYYHGERTAKVTLQKGEGVTDVYYIMGQQLFDEKRTHANPEWNEGIYRTVDKYLVDEYIAEYKAGESNDAYIVGRVDDNALEFEMPLPDSEGIKRMFIVAYSGDQITDMVFDMIEVRKPHQWTDYGTVDIDSRMEWSPRSQYTNNLIESGTYSIETNEDGTLYRVVKPFATDENPDANYLYINAALGLDLCYIESSYAPVEHHYNYTDLAGNEQTITRPYLMQDIISIHELRGFKTSNLANEFLDYFINLKNGSGYNRLSIAREYNTQLCSEFDSYLNGIYSNHSYGGSLGFKLSDAVAATPDARGVNFEVGATVNYLICSFGYDNAPTDETQSATTVGEDATFRVTIDSGNGFIDIHSLIKNKEIPGNPTRIYYTAYNGNDKILRTGDFDLSDCDFSKSITSVEYSTNYEYFTNATLGISREDDMDNGIATFTVENFGSTLKYADSDINISFKIKDNELIEYPTDFYIETFNFPEIGTLPVYASFRELSYAKTSDEGILSGTLYYMVYDPESQQYTRYYMAVASFTLTIPEELTYELAGIEDIVVDDNNVTPIYYNLQGIRVDKPAPGSILIEVKGKSARKIIYN